MSSTPLLERTATQAADAEWIDVLAPEADPTPAAVSTADLVIAIGAVRSDVEAGREHAITFDTDQLAEPDADDYAAARYAADIWDA